MHTIGIGNEWKTEEELLFICKVNLKIELSSAYS